MPHPVHTRSHDSVMGRGDRATRSGVAAKRDTARASAAAAAALALVCASTVLLAPQPASAATAQRSCVGTHWVTDWALAPSDSLLATPVSNQTLRQFAIPHLSGTRARLHFSNRYSSTPVTFGHVTVADQSSGAAVQPSTLRTVTFHGSQTVTIPAGGDIVSDPVDVAMTAFHRLAVSTYISGVATPTEHFLAEQTSYQTLPLAGDHAADTSASAFVVQTPVAGTGVHQSFYYLSGLDVLAPKKVGAVAAFGDSITDGFQGTLAPVVPSAAQIDKQTRWPDRLAVRLAAAGRPLTTFDEGISSNQLTAANPVTPFAGPPGLQRFDKDVLAQYGISDVIVLEGINDIGQSGTTASTLIAAYKTLIAKVHAAGLKIQLGTLTPQNGTLQPGYGAAAEPTRTAVNTWIRTQHLSNGYIDFDKAVRDPADPSRILPAYDGGDHLHFDAAGYQAMANAVPLPLLAQPTCSSAVTTPTPAPSTTNPRNGGPATTVSTTHASGALANSGAPTLRLLLGAPSLITLGLVFTLGAPHLSEELMRLRRY